MVKKIFFLFITIIFTTGALYSKDIELPLGTTISIVTGVVLTSDKTAPNSEFSTKTNLDIISPDGKVLIPSGSVVVGKVLSIDKTKITVALIRIKIGERYYNIMTDSLNLIAKTQKDNTGKAVAVGALIGGAVRYPGRGRKVRGAIVGGVVGGAVAKSKQKEQILQVPSGTNLQFKLSAATKFEVE